MENPPTPWLMERTVTTRSAGPPKVARTACRAETLTVQGPVPEQAPLHPEKTESPEGTAAKVTEVAPPNG
jgi:hypothetical protein